MPQPTFIQQYGPIIAALVALIGVFFTLSVSGRRERKLNLIAREDEYRREQRQAIAAIVVAAHNYRREASALGHSETWGKRGYDQTTAICNAAEQAMSELLNQLTIARLLVHSIRLQEAIDDLYRQFDITGGHVNALVNTYWDKNSDVMDNAVTQLHDSWPRYDRAATSLHAIALDELKPTIMNGSGRIRTALRSIRRQLPWP